MLIKYPKTMHLPFSQGLQNDDRRIETLDGLIGREVVVTEKMDGENTSLYRDHLHARSLDSRHHPSRDWVKTFWGQRAHQIPEGWRICGENVYAVHSICYDDLETYFYAFSAWDGERCFSWDDSLVIFDELGIKPVPTLYRGEFDLDKLMQIADDLNVDRQEGFVVRVVDAFDYSDFSTKIAKYVRKGHVQTDEHWMHADVVPNGLRAEV